MKKCRITVMKVTEHRDLMERFENPMENACGMQEGQVFIANGCAKFKAKVRLKFQRKHRFLKLKCTPMWISAGNGWIPISLADFR